MPSTVQVVLLASAQSVCKVYLIGVIGFLATRFPKDNPLLPVSAVGTVSRFSFHTLVLCLIFSTIAKSVNYETFPDYWFVITGAVGVLVLSYVSATILGKLMLDDYNSPRFRALRISSTFPNIVALPILIFPSLCEFPEIRNGYQLGTIETCTETSNAMVFSYFFSWSLFFWVVAYPQLMHAVQLERDQRADDDVAPPEVHIEPTDAPGDTTEADEEKMEDQPDSKDSDGDDAQEEKEERGFFWGLRKTFSSPGFIALFLGIVTGSISFLRDAMFEPGASLRFLGDGLETLGRASSPLATMIVAASLLPPAATRPNAPDEPQQEPRLSRLRSLRRSIHHGSVQAWETIVLHNTKANDVRLIVWFTLSRLILAPAMVIAVVHFLNVPAFAKFVVILNSCLPGALIVVVLLKSENSQIAGSVAQVYLPSYLLSIVTIAGWTAFGLWLTLPGEDAVDSAT